MRAAAEQGTAEHSTTAAAAVQGTAEHSTTAAAAEQELLNTQQLLLLLLLYRELLLNSEQSPRCLSAQRVPCLGSPVLL